jgi:hypothetical protein
MTQEDIFREADAAGFTFGYKLPNEKGNLKSFKVIRIEAEKGDTPTKLVNKIIEAFGREPIRGLLHRGEQLSQLIGGYTDQGITLIVIVESAHLLNRHTVHSLKLIREHTTQPFPPAYASFVLLGNPETIQATINADPSLYQRATRLPPSIKLVGEHLENDEAARLTLTYEQFVEVLSQWDAYARVEFSEMARHSSVYIGTEGDWMMFGDRPSPGYAFTKQVDLSDLAELLWKTLEAGAAEVDRIHDTAFIESQVEHFKKTYASPEHVASLMRDEYGDTSTLDAPTDMFSKLGKPAQMVVRGEGILLEAIEIYEQAKEIIRNEEQAEKIESERKRQKGKQVIETRKRVCELDKWQCVFCGVQVSNNFRYVQVTPGEFLPENVVFSCAPCNTKIKHKVSEAAEMKLIYGRFSEKECSANE